MDNEPKLQLKSLSVVSHDENVYLIGLDRNGQVWEKEVTSAMWVPHTMDFEPLEP